MILDVNNVTISYIVNSAKDMSIKELVVRGFRNKDKQPPKRFEAVKNVSFQLKRGDFCSIVGTNGSGKSSLLRPIANIIRPTKGTISSYGKVVALLELSAGFDAEMTVRENTMLRGALLGYTRAFMDEKYDEIIDFAELGEFQDRTFRQLSSGMKSRLGFAIACLIEPEILILDEVLSVGDGAFRKKSQAKMKEIIDGGATTIFVSHSLGQVREMSNKVLWLNKGEQIAFGETTEVCDMYEEFLKTGKIPLHLVKK